MTENINEVYIQITPQTNQISKFALNSYYQTTFNIPGNYPINWDKSFLTWKIENVKDESKVNDVYTVAMDRGKLPFNQISLTTKQNSSINYLPNQGKFNIISKLLPFLTNDIYELASPKPVLGTDGDTLLITAKTEKEESAFLQCGALSKNINYNYSTTGTTLTISTTENSPLNVKLFEQVLVAVDGVSQYTAINTIKFCIGNFKNTVFEIPNFSLGEDLRLDIWNCMLPQIIRYYHNAAIAYTGTYFGMNTVLSQITDLNVTMLLDLCVQNNQTMIPRTIPKGTPTLIPWIHYKETVNANASFTHSCTQQIDPSEISIIDKIMFAFSYNVGGVTTYQDVFIQDYSLYTADAPTTTAKFLNYTSLFDSKLFFQGSCNKQQIWQKMKAMFKDKYVCNSEWDYENNYIICEYNAEKNPSKMIKLDNRSYTYKLELNFDSSLTAYPVTIYMFFVGYKMIVV